MFNQTQTALVEYPAGNVATSYTIPNNVTSIAQQALQGCKHLKNVTIPDSVTNISDEAFFLCTNLSSVTIPNSVTSIGDEAFAESGLTNITIPDSVTGIGESEFTYCANLTAVTIPDSVTNIGSQAFSECARLATVKIPASVTSIADNAFAACNDLRGVYFEGDVPSADSTVFLSDTLVTAYYLPGTTGWTTTFGGSPTALRLPQVQTTDGFFGVQSNQFGFNISWASNYSVTVQASTSLSSPSWTTLTNVTLTNGLFYFADANWTNSPARYYRLSSP
jgi:hypothetical protein